VAGLGTQAAVPVTAPPIPALLQISFQQRGHLVGRDVAVDLLVDHHDGGQAAGAEAAGAFEREETVLAGFAPRDAQLVDDPLRDAVGPLT